eukprot:2599412-Rhodomonas_salina.2
MLRLCYAMSGTERAYAASKHYRTDPLYATPAYAAIVLHVPYKMSSTDIASVALVLRFPWAASGTDIAYACTSELSFKLHQVSAYGAATRRPGRIWSEKEGDEKMSKNELYLPELRGHGKVQAKSYGKESITARTSTAERVLAEAKAKEAAPGSVLSAILLGHGQYAARSRPIIHLGH